MNASVAAKSDVGRVREGNEDSYLVQEPLFVVADGMGGHLAGDVASQTAVQLITDKTKGSSLDPATLASLIREANAVIHNKAQADASLHGMGTTCTLLLLEDNDAHLAHVGDSRAYLFRDGKLEQLTEDHTLVQRMVKEGRLKKEEANKHPQRSIITRALGVDPDVTVDTMDLQVRAGDRFLLCSDGLTSMIDDSAIAEVLARGDEPQASVDRLVELANEAGGEDNITAVLIDVTDVDGGVSSTRGGGAIPAGGASTTERTPTPSPPTAEAPSSAPPVGADSTAVRSGAADTGYFSAAEVAEGRSGEKDWDVVPEPLRPRWGRIVLGLVLVIAILGAAAYIGARYLWLERSFFVGVNPAGAVTIYRGVPEDFAGMQLHWEEQVSDLQLADVPEFLQEDLEAGIEAESLDDAQIRLHAIEERAADAEFEKEQEAQQAEDQKEDAANDGGKN